jgi:hypothetical protein
MTIIPSRKKTAPARAPQSPSDLPAPTGNTEPLGQACSEGAEPFMRLEIDGRRVTVRFELSAAGASEELAAAVGAPGGDLPHRPGQFATIHAAGGAAICCQILPLTEADVIEAVSHCARDHVAFVAQEPGGAVASEAHSVAVVAPPTPYAALRAYLDGPGARRFIDLRQPGARVPRGHVHARARGYCGLYRGHPEIWLPHACFERVAGGPAQARALKTELHAQGLIVSERRGQRRCFSIKRDVPGLGRVRVVVLHP